MTAGNRLRLLVFVLLGGLAVVYVGARYAGLSNPLDAGTYQVRVELAESGGLFPRGEVTFRGVSVGRVQDLDFDTDGVTAVLTIDDAWRIPADLTAEVHNRSAVGEQYVDLVPRTDAGPYLRDGSVVARDDTTTPTDEQELIVAADGLFRSIPRDDLTTVIDESAAAFDGAGDDLGRLLDNGQTIIDAANRSRADTVALLRDGGTVLETQDDQAKIIEEYLGDLAKVTDVVADRDGHLRVVLSDGATAARELRRLADGLAPNLPGLLANTIQLSGILTNRLDQVEETLVSVPFALASALTPGRGGLAHFTFVGGISPQPCRTGYIPADQWKSIHDPIPSVLSADIGCKTASSVPRGVVGAPGKLAY